MNIADIIALAKQGYKPSDIKELLELSKSSETESNPSNQEKDPDPEEPKQDPDPDPEEEEHEEDPEPDYKQMYEDLKKETQKKNVRTNSQNEEPKSNEEKMAEIMRSLL